MSKTKKEIDTNDIPFIELKLGDIRNGEAIESQAFRFNKDVTFVVLNEDVSKHFLGLDQEDLPPENAYFINKITLFEHNSYCGDDGLDMEDAGKIDYEKYGVKVVQNNSRRLADMTDEKKRKEILNRNGFPVSVKSRVKNKFRRLVLVLMDTKALFNIIKSQLGFSNVGDPNCASTIFDKKDVYIEEPGSIKFESKKECVPLVGKDVLTNIKRQIQNYSEHSVSISLKEISKYVDNTKHQFDYLNVWRNYTKYLEDRVKNKLKITLQVRLLTSGSDEKERAQTLQFLNEKIWETDDGEKGELISNLLSKTVGRREAAKRRKTGQIMKRNHVLKKEYIYAKPVTCYVCKIMGTSLIGPTLMKCTNSKCEVIVHQNCIAGIYTLCSAQNKVYNQIGNDESPARGQGAGIEIDTEHVNIQNDKFVWFGASCCQSSRIIRPFSRAKYCDTCNEYWHSKVDPMNDCDIAQWSVFKNLQYKLRNDVHEFDNSYASNPYGAIGPSPRHANQINADTNFTNFKLLGFLGKGSFGKVLLVRHEKCESDDYTSLMALKCIRKDATLQEDNVEDILNEKNSLTVKHHYLATAICMFDDKQYLYILMEFLPGSDLFAVLINQKPEARLDEKVAKTYGCEIMLGLEFMHDENDMVFRDLKLDNVLIDAKGRTRIADFGFAKKLIEKDGRKEANTFCGTPDYMAPEILEEKPYDFKVDVWAWAICMFELIEGSSPFNINNDSEDQLYERIKYKNINLKKRCRHMSPGLQTLISEVLTKDPRNRPSAREILKKDYFQKKKDFVKKIRDNEHKAPMKLPANDYTENLKNFEKSDETVDLNRKEVRKVTDKEDEKFGDFAWEDRDLRTQYFN